MKRFISVTAILKLFRLLTGISAGNPLQKSNKKPGMNVNIIYLTNDAFKQMIFNYE